MDDGLARHPVLRVNPRPACGCRPAHRSPLAAPRIPALFRTYVELGAQVPGPPAIDREFKTIDWLVLLDTAELPTLVHPSMFR